MCVIYELTLLCFDTVIVFAFTQDDNAEDTDDEYHTDYETGDDKQGAIIDTEMINNFEQVISHI